MKKSLKVVLLVPASLVLGVAALVFIIQGPPVVQGETDLAFQEIALEFEHALDLEGQLPFMGVSAVDVDGDGIDEIFLGNGDGHADGLFRFGGDGFRKIDGGPGLDKPDDEATFGAASIDATGDGKDDLFLARESGVYFLENQGDGNFVKRLIDFGMADNTTPLSVALGDINRDGWVDLYVSGYIRYDLVEGETNFDLTYGGYSYLLLNNGDNTWKDISKEAGVFRKHNTFLAMFIDLDNDQWADLVVAQDTGIVEVWQNNRDQTFTRKENPTDYGYPMGIGAGDIDNDGFVDLYLSNVDNTMPDAMLRGNLSEDLPFNTDYMLLRNKGNFQFEDVSVARNAAEYGFGWGVTVEDFTNDGRQDLYFAQNYARFPGVDILLPYPGRLLQQYPNGNFQAVETVAGLANKNFGISQVVSDFNQDGWPDIVLANLNGPSRAFLNQGGDRHWLTVQLPDGAEWLNTMVKVTTPSGKSITRQLCASEGLCSDSTDALFFGLGDETGKLSVEVLRPGATVRKFTDIAADSLFKVDI